MNGHRRSEGERRAIDAAEAAIQTPARRCVDEGAAGLCITSPATDMTCRVDEAANGSAEEVDPDANIIFRFDL